VKSPVGKIPRAFAWRTSLTILIIFFIIVRPANIDIVGASDTDIPEPLSMEPTANMFVDSEDADKGFTLIAPFNGKKVFLVF
jgi:hypothetical protein